MIFKKPLFLSFGVLFCYLLTLFFVPIAASTVFRTVIVNFVFFLLLVVLFKTTSVLQKPVVSTQSHKYKKSYLFIIFFCLWFFGQSFSVWLKNNIQSDSFQQYQASIADNIGVTLVLVLVAAPLFEELLCRGLFYSCFQRVMPKMVAWFAQAALFSVLHMTPIHLWVCFLFGLFLGYVYETTGKLWLCILFHVLFNALTCFMPLGPLSVGVIVVGNLFLFGYLIYSYFMLIKHEKENNLCVD